MTFLLKRYFFIGLLPVMALAQPSDKKYTLKQYIEKYSELAVNEMLIHKIPASITLAQGILESGFGNTPLAIYANNHFGIKCHGDWSGPTFTLDDDAPGECFRRYENVGQSYSDHSLFIRGRRWYKPLFELKITDYKGWAKGLKAAGYATEPKYAEQLIQLIEKYKLYEYDSQMLTVTTLSVTLEKKSQTVIYPKRAIHVVNRRKYIETNPGDTFYGIATEFALPLAHLMVYNDVDEGYKLKANEIIFIEPKRSKTQERTHTVLKGESMHSISQQHGLKLKKLYQRNKMEIGTQPKVGEVLQLRKHK